MQLHYFADSAKFARRLGTAVGVTPTAIREHHFPDGETMVRARVPVDRHAVLVRSLHDPNVKLVETLLAADGLRRAGAKRVTLVAPYLPYMRQDKVFQPGEPISQRVLGSLLAHAFDRVLTIEAHLHRIQKLQEIVPGRSLTAAPAIAAWLHRQRDILVVGPDSESRPWVRSIAAAAQTSWVVGNKQRFADRRVRVQLPELPACRRAVIVDDIASSGATIADTARALRQRGIDRIDAIIVHAIFSAGAMERIQAAGVERIVSCDTIPHRTNRIHCGEVIAAALQPRS